MCGARGEAPHGGGGAGAGPAALCAEAHCGGRWGAARGEALWSEARAPRGRPQGCGGGGWRAGVVRGPAAAPGKALWREGWAPWRRAGSAMWRGARAGGWTTAALGACLEPRTPNPGAAAALEGGGGADGLPSGAAKWPPQDGGRRPPRPRRGGRRRRLCAAGRRRSASAPPMRAGGAAARAKGNHAALGQLSAASVPEPRGARVLLPVPRCTDSWQ